MRKHQNFFNSTNINNAANSYVNVKINDDVIKISDPSKLMLTKISDNNENSKVKYKKKKNVFIIRDSMVNGIEEPDDFCTNQLLSISYQIYKSFDHRQISEKWISTLIPKNNRKSLDTHPPLTFNKKFVKQVQFKKHLGVCLDGKVGFREHLQNMFEKVNKTISLLPKLQNNLPRTPLCSNNS